MAKTYNVKRYNDKHVFTTKNNVLIHNGVATELAANDDNLVDVVRANTQQLMPIVASAVAPEMRELLDFMNKKYPALVEEHHLNAKTSSKIWYQLAYKSKPIARKCIDVINFSRANADALRAKIKPRPSVMAGRS